MIIRPQYMNTLKTYRNVPLVKILAGIRRCGKSIILDSLLENANTDIYVTGSNSKLMSSEISTYLQLIPFLHSRFSCMGG